MNHTGYDDDPASNQACSPWPLENLPSKIPSLDKPSIQVCMSAPVYLCSTTEGKWGGITQPDWYQEKLTFLFTTLFFTPFFLSADLLSRKC